MLKQNMQDALNEQINREFYAFYAYLSMAAYFDAQNLTGFAHWMYVQSAEEQVHAMRLFHFVIERGGQVQLRPVAAPPAGFGTPLAVFEQALAQERQVTKWINELFELAIKEQDHATRVHLQWFVTEQVEEEDVVGEIVDNLKLAGENKTALLMLDRDFRQRTADGPAAGSS